MKQNIVVFFTDQQRADTCGCYGQPLDLTPALDKFASEGVVFNNAYTCQPVCGPARAAIQSGLYPTKIGCYRNAIALPTDIPTIAKELSKQGYKTAYVGKWHLATTEGKNNYETSPIPNELRGGYKDCFTAADILEFTSHGYGGYVFDKDNNKLEFDGYRPDCITDYALDFLEKQTESEPFFLFLSHIEPHHQNDRNQFEGPNGSKEKYKDCPIPEDLLNLSGDYKQSYPDYLGCVNQLDYNFKRVLNTLEKKGLSDNTVVFFCSDHGSHFRTRNREYKRSCHDASIRIPFVVKGKEFKGGKVNDSVISLIDLPKTILSCAGIDMPSFDGNNLIEVASGKLDPDCAFIQISEDHLGRAIRTKQYTYEIYRPDLDAWNLSSADSYLDAYLYDNYADPNQTKNLINEPSYRKDKHKLREMIKQKIANIEGKNIVIIDT